MQDNQAPDKQAGKMPTHRLLSKAEVDAGLAALNGWVCVKDGKAMSKDFVFKNFKAAFAFMTRVAQKAEELQHHPDWQNIYNKVFITLNTHEAGGITALDLQLAALIDAENK
jgi:4a-hydroxytetrahydrobiopterin dehydratase